MVRRPSLCQEAPECVLELVELGCEFDRTELGQLHLAREGGQSVARSAHSGDATGAADLADLGLGLGFLQLFGKPLDGRP
jgi:aspartate oxidase